MAIFEFSGAQVQAEPIERTGSRLTWFGVGGDEKQRPGAIRLAEEALAAIAANDAEALDRIELYAYEVNPVVE